MKISLSVKILVVICLFCAVFGIKTFNAQAEDLSDEINEQLEDLDLSDLEDYFDKYEFDNYSFGDTIKRFLTGDYSFNYEGLGEYLKNVFFENITKLFPVMGGLFFITITCALVQNLRTKSLGENINSIIKFACLSCIIILLSGEFYIVVSTVKNTIGNMAKFNEIMSPIILTLMVASGSNVSAGIYKPIVLFLTNGIINVFYSLILPLICIITVVNVVSCFSTAVKLKKFSEFLSGVLKWLIGIIVTVYGFFITIQGISGASFDRVSVKFAKYAIGSGVPLVGGLLKEGFDVVMAGSIIIKNSVGIAGIIGLFYSVLSPILFLVSLSLLLKLSSAVIGVFYEDGISDFLSGIAKSVTYFSVCIITVGFMSFITTLFMVFSVNAVF